MTRHSASRDVLYSTPPGPDADDDEEGAEAATLDELAEETSAPSAADD